MKKKLLFCLMFFALCANCFAERRTRVDTYKNRTVKIVWDDNHRDAPPDKNLAKDQYNYNPDSVSWKSIILYHYSLNPKHGKGKAAEIMLYDGESYYLITENYYRDGLWEKVYHQEFYYYNAARNVFDTIADRLEKYIK